MFLIAAKLLDLAFAPLTWALLACGFAGWKATTRPARAAALAALFGLWLPSTPAVAQWIARSAEAGVVSTVRDGVVYDVAIVPAGMLDESTARVTGQPAYNGAVDRIIVAHELWRIGRARRVLVSGGTFDPASRSEAELVADQLVAWGMPRDAVGVETQALDTYENAVRTAALVKAQGLATCVIVTSAAHIPRTDATHRAAGLACDLLPVDRQRWDDSGLGFAAWLPRASALAMSTSALRELAGRVVYRVVGRG